MDIFWSEMFWLNVLGAAWVYLFCILIPLWGLMRALKPSGPLEDLRNTTYKDRPQDWGPKLVAVQPKPKARVQPKARREEMSQNSVAVEPKPKTLPFPDTLRLEARFPFKEGLERKIVHLFDGAEGDAYRVNYLDPKTGFIPESHFVLVKGTGPDDIKIH